MNKQKRTKQSFFIQRVNTSKLQQVIKSYRGAGLYEKENSNTGEATQKKSTRPKAVFKSPPRIYKNQMPAVQQKRIPKVPRPTSQRFDQILSIKRAPTLSSVRDVSPFYTSFTDHLKTPQAKLIKEEHTESFEDIIQMRPVIAVKLRRRKSIEVPMNVLASINFFN